MCNEIKRGSSTLVDLAALRMRQTVEVFEPLADFVTANSILIPVPRSAPIGKGALWPALLIARALVAQSLGRVVHEAIERTRAVPKSAFAAPGQRPTLEKHIETMAVRTAALPPGPLLLVDDVVTKGRTLFAAASRLAEAFPARDIRGFALIRTRGLVTEIDKILDPFIGSIDTNDAGDVDRTGD